MDANKTTIEDLGIKSVEILNTIADGISIQDPSGKLLFANKPAARMCGFATVDEMLSTPVKEFIKRFTLIDEKGDLFPVKRLPGRRAFMGEGAPESVIGFTYQGSNDVQWSIVRARPIFNNKKEIIAVVNMFSNITHQVRFEQELKRRATFRAAVAQFGEKALQERDLQVLMNEAVRLIKELLQVDAVKILELQSNQKSLLFKAGVGWSKKLTGKTFVEIGKDTQAAYTLKMKKPVVVKDLYKEKRFRGHEFLYENTITSGVSHIIDGLDKPYGTIGVYTKAMRDFTQSDIHFIQLFTNVLSAAVYRTTSEKKFYESEKQSQEQYKSLMEYASDGILVLDLNATIIEVNKKATEMFGYSKKELVGMNAMGLVHPEDIENNALKFDQIRKGKSVLSERRVRTKNGTYVLTEISSALVGGSRIFSIIRDITERKESEKQREILLGVVSHEIKNSLMNITGFTYILNKHFQKTNDTKSLTYFSKLEVQLNKLSKIIIDMLDLTRIRSGRLEFRDEKFDVEELVIEVIESFQASKTHKIEYSGHSIKKLRGDKNRVSQVLNNLISNAIKYSPHAHKVVVKLSQDDKCVTVSVQDFGMGIPKDSISKVFELFYRGTNTQTSIFGIGLGLYISDIIVRHHGGKIWVESKVGKGSTFYFSIPFKRGKIRSTSVPIS